jgi:hypothetical protein
MKIKSFGCSFIFGNDLQDVNTHLGEPYAPPSKFTWPSLLAQNLGYNYECHARPGSGNLRILEKVLSHAAQEQESAAYVIGWSLIDRFDYTVDPDKKTHQYDMAGLSRWCTIMPIHNDLRSQHYYQDLHSQFRDKLSNLIYIKTAIDTLKQKNIKFIMTYADELLFETEYHTNPAILDLQDFVRPYLTTFENKTFVKFSKSRGFAISSTMHPLEDAHRAAFETIKSYNLL